MLRFTYLITGALFFLFTAVAAAASFNLVYDTPKSDDEKDAREFLDDEGVIRTITTLVDREFELRRDLSLFLGSTEGPLFDAVADEIRFPYVFVYDIADRFYRDSYSGSGADVYDVTRDAYLHALLHELSHALFVMYDLRTSGSMEDAVDALTVLLLLQYYEDGGQIALNAAELFVDEDASAQASGEAPDFWTTHQFDQQSYNQALCLVFGSDPQRYSYLRQRTGFLQIRDQECIREYQRQVNAWFRALASFLKRPPPG